MKRTTVFVDDDLLVDAQHLAKQRHTTFTDIVQQALRAYVQAQRTPPRLSFIGMGQTAHPTHAMREGWDEAELMAGIDREYGWSTYRADVTLNDEVEVQHSRCFDGRVYSAVSPL